MARKSKSERELDELEREFLDDPDASEETKQAAKDFIDELRRLDEETKRISRILRNPEEFDYDRLCVGGGFKRRMLHRYILRGIKPKSRAKEIAAMLDKKY